MSTERRDLFYDGILGTPEPGDFWTAWRNDVCVGNVRYNGNGDGYTVILSIGQAFTTRHGFNSLEEAQDGLEMLFAQWLERTSLGLKGANRPPEHWQPPQEWLIPAIKGIKTSAGVKAYMNTSTVFRTIAGMSDNYQRKRILGEAKIHMEKLQREEAARDAGEAA